MLTILFSLSIAGCSHGLNTKNEKQQWDYPPMISIGNLVYIDTGDTKDSLAEDWILLGKVEKEVSQTEAMVKENNYFISNTLPAGTEIFGKEKEGETIYAKYNNKFIKYDLMQNK